MSMMRRYAAALVAASALTLGACGSEAPTVVENPTDGSVVDNPRLIQINPMSMVFSSATSTAPGPQTLAVSGLVAIGSAVTFGPVVYSPAAGAWLHVDPRPTFRRDPLAWLHQVSINQAAFAALANGTYTATIPVIVPAALNSPQMLTVVLCKGATACLPLYGSAMGELTTGDGIWDRSTIFGGAPDPFDLEFFDDWIIVLGPGQHSYIRMNGGGCGTFGGTLDDPYLVVYEGPITDVTDYVDRNDDNDCLNSEVYIENLSGVTKFYTIRATSFDEFDDDGDGTYTLISSPTAFFSLRAEEPSEHPLVAAKRESGLR